MQNLTADCLLGSLHCGAFYSVNLANRYGGADFVFHLFASKFK